METLCDIDNILNEMVFMIISLCAKAQEILIANQSYRSEIQTSSDLLFKSSTTIETWASELNFSYFKKLRFRIECLDSLIPTNNTTGTTKGT